MKSISAAIIFALLITVLASCSSPTAKPSSLPVTTATPKPVTLTRVINHEKPTFPPMGSPTTFFGVKGCDQFFTERLFGGLSPNFPIASCIYYFPEEASREDIPPDECFHIAVGFQWMTCQKYVIPKDGSFLFINNMDEVREIFAPVDSPEEALAFALMSNDDYSALYGQTEKDGYVYYVETIEDTHVDVALPEGYIVHLFEVRIFGCGPFDVFEVEVSVSRKGQVAESRRFPIYRDPSLDTLCAD